MRFFNRSPFLLLKGWPNRRRLRRENGSFGCTTDQTKAFWRSIKKRWAGGQWITMWDCVSKLFLQRGTPVWNEGHVGDTFWSLLWDSSPKEELYLLWVFIMPNQLSIEMRIAHCRWIKVMLEGTGIWQKRTPFVSWGQTQIIHRKLGGCSSTKT